jgi:hypothetical protein
MLASCKCYAEDATCKRLLLTTSVLAKKTAKCKNVRLPRRLILFLLLRQRMFQPSVKHDISNEFDRYAKISQQNCDFSQMLFEHARDKFNPQTIFHAYPCLTNELKHFYF